MTFGLLLGFAQPKNPHMILRMLYLWFMYYAQIALFMLIQKVLS